MINDTLDINMIESSKFEKRQDIFCPTDAFNFVLSLFETNVKQYKTSLNLKFVRFLYLPSSINDEMKLSLSKRPVVGEECSLPKRLLGDHIRLKQVLINLITNAFKCTRRGAITVYAAFDPDEDILKVHVADTGQGLTKS